MWIGVVGTYCCYGQLIDLCRSGDGDGTARHGTLSRFHSIHRQNLLDAVTTY